MTDRVEELEHIIRDGFCTGQMHSFHEHHAATRELATIAREAERLREERDTIWLAGRGLAQAAEKVIGGQWDAIAMRTRIGDFYAAAAREAASAPTEAEWNADSVIRDVECRRESEAEA